MKPTLLLLSLVAIALILGTEARLAIPSDGCTREKFYSLISKGDLYKDQPEWLKVCTRRAHKEHTFLTSNKVMQNVALIRMFSEVCDDCGDDLNCFLTQAPKVALTMPECHQPRRDEMDDEEVGGFSVEAGYEKDGKYAKIKWEKDEMDDDCTREKFYSFMLEAEERRPAGSMPVIELIRSSAGPCVLKTFLEVCDECEDDFNCLQTRGAEVSPTVPECNQPRRLTSPIAGGATDGFGAGYRISMKYSRRERCLKRCKGKKNRRRCENNCMYKDARRKYLFDEMDDEEVGWDDFGKPSHVGPQKPTGESIWNSIMWDEMDEDVAQRRWTGHWSPPRDWKPDGETSSRVYLCDERCKDSTRKQMCLLNCNRPRMNRL